MHGQLVSACVDLSPGSLSSAWVVTSLLSHATYNWHSWQDDAKTAGVAWAILGGRYIGGGRQFTPVCAQAGTSWSVRRVVTGICTGVRVLFNSGDCDYGRPLLQFCSHTAAKMNKKNCVQWRLEIHWQRPSKSLLSPSLKADYICNYIYCCMLTVLYTC